MPESKFLSICHERGFVHQCTDEDALDALLATCEQQKKPLVAYIGFDCTAPSLHVGSLIQIMILRWLQKCGHKPIVLMGGGTTKVGDPSGKDQSRQLLDDAAIEANKQGIKKVFSHFLKFEEDCHPGEGRGLVEPDAVMRRHDIRGIGHNKPFNPDSTDAVMVDNNDWLENLKLIDFLRDYGAHLSMSAMLGKESVKLRLERQQHMSFLEFNYMVLQAYDFVKLAEEPYCCSLQIGGSDQWGNITTGIELYKKHASKNDPGSRLKFKNSDGTKNKSVVFGYDNLFGLTTPLLTTSFGAKMGKTAEGAVWLNAEMFSPYDYWQYWRNTEDADVGRFLRLFTELPLDEIQRLESLPGAGINDAKKVLATEATALLHGRAEAEKAAATAKQTFEQGETAETLPEAAIPASELDGGNIAAFKLFHLAGLAASSKEAKRLIQGGGARINDAPVADENAAIALKSLAFQGPVKLSAGKKKHVRLKLLT